MKDKQYTSIFQEDFKKMEILKVEKIKVWNATDPTQLL